MFFGWGASSTVATCLRDKYNAEIAKKKEVLMNNFSNILHHRKKGAKGGGKLKEKENASSAYFRCVTSLTPEVQILKRDVFRFDI